MRRSAFTFIEVIIVIVIMGIVAMIASEVITKIYEQYLLNRGVSILEEKTEEALDLIEKRLEFRIKESVIARQGSTIVALTDATDDYDILEWIGYDNDGLLGTGTATSSYNQPAWDAFADLESATESNFSSPGSDFSTENTILETLSNNKVSLDPTKTSVHRPALFFKGTRGYYDVNKFGWNGSGDNNYSLRVVYNDNTTLDFVDRPDMVSERYLLSFSAFAIVPEGSDCDAALPTDCNLTLYYNFQPWEGEKYSDDGIPHALLIDHITTFRFRQVGRSIHLKLCAMDAGFNKYMEENISVCKERVVY